MSTATKTFRAVLIDALDEAIYSQQDKSLFCRDCGKAPDGSPCADHEESDALAGEWESAKALIQTGDAAELAALLAGTETQR